MSQVFFCRLTELTPVQQGFLRGRFPGDIGEGKQTQIEDSAVSDTRTSLNSWISRETSPIFDAIYRRAADVLRIDEALLRHRGEDEYPEWPSRGSIAESLQLVHYDPGQKYTAHHGAYAYCFKNVGRLL